MEKEKSKAFIRTDRAIETAFIRLLKKTPFDEITVQDILDETPVTRATFYAHYHDKYEIAERMREAYFITQRQMYEKTKNMDSDPATLSGWIRQGLTENRELAEALLKIHTPTVDIAKELKAMLRAKYLLRADSATKEVEADIYAETMLAYEMSFFRYGTDAHSDVTALRTIMTNVFFNVLQVTDEKIRESLKKQLEAE